MSVFHVLPKSEGGWPPSRIRCGCEFFHGVDFDVNCAEWRCWCERMLLVVVLPLSSVVRVGFSELANTLMSCSSAMLARCKATGILSKQKFSLVSQLRYILSDP
jgi:hypothetical protein